MCCVCVSFSRFVGSESLDLDALTELGNPIKDSLDVLQSNTIGVLADTDILGNGSFYNGKGVEFE